MQHRLATTVALAMAALIVAVPAGAQSSDETKPPPRPSATEDEQRSIYTFQVENDVFNRFGRSDRDYTSGVRDRLAVAGLTEMPDGHRGDDHHPDLLGRGRRRLR